MWGVLVAGLDTLCRPTSLGFLVYLVRQERERKHKNKEKMRGNKRGRGAGQGDEEEGSERKGMWVGKGGVILLLL